MQARPPIPGPDQKPAEATPPAEVRKSRALSADRARHLLAYDPETGLLCRQRASFRLGRRPKPVRTINKDGHPVVKLDGTTYIASRVIFLTVTGRWPEPTCIHIDNDQKNLRWSNLREASFSELTYNRRISKRAV